jgi:DNA-binding CsgD family transcriptional regulator
MPESIEKLERKLSRINDPDKITEKCELLEQIALAYERIGDPVKALSYYKKLLAARIQEIEERSKNHLREHSQFEKGHDHVPSEFEEGLLKKYPTLTKTERRLCSLMKLGLTSQQIADLLYTSLRTVEWHRLNIRKKMQIQDHHEIQAFLEQAISVVSPR